MTAAANIDEAITYAGSNIATVSYGGTLSLYTQFQSWITGMFSEAGIYKPSMNPPQSSLGMGQRAVTDWFAWHLIAQQAIEGTAVNTSGLVGTSAVIDAVVRVLSAVKFAMTNSQITAAQQTATVALFNSAWP